MSELAKMNKILDDHEKRLKKLEGGKKQSHGKNNDNNSSIMDFLMELKDDGFFNKPKLLKEIIAELARRGHHYNNTSLTEPLQRAVRQKKLGRVGQKGKWQYVSR